MNPVILFRQSLGLRLITISAFVVGSVMILSSTIAVHWEVDALNESMDKHARGLVETVATSVIEPLLVDDYPVLETYLTTLVGQNLAVRSVQVKRRDGAIVASSVIPDLGAVGSGVSQKVYRADVVLAGIGHRGHIGEVILEVSNAPGQLLLRSRMRTVLATALVTALTLIAVMGFLFQRGVVSRISRLREGASRIGRGDLASPIPIQSADELGQLAGAFESMRSDLMAAFAERDRTRIEIQSSRDHLSAVLASTPDGIIVFDASGIIHSMNPFAEALFDRTEESVLGEPFSNLIPDFKFPSNAEDWHPDRGWVVEGEAALGTSISLRLSIGMYTLAGSVMGVAIVSDASILDSLLNVESSRTLSATAREVAEGRAKTLLELNEQLVETQAQLLQSQKMEALGQLAGGVAHDFNNLLMVINGHTENLLEDADENSGRRELEQILEAGRMAAGLTLQLLAFGRKQVFQTQLVDLSTIVADAEPLVQRLLNANIRLELLPDAEPVWVEMDVVQLQQIILNLALNSRDAMPEGGTLTLETGRRGPPESASPGRNSKHAGPWACLTVADTGCGMTPHTKEHLFEPFFTTKALGRGTGLGLSTTFGVVEQSRGHIEVESEPNLGSRISVLVPLCDAPIPKGEGIRESRESDSGAERPAHTGTAPKAILLVEDQEGIRSFVRTLLTDHGHDVVEAANGLEALERLAKRGAQAFHLILSDVSMPEMSGRELAIRVMQDYPNLKIILMSGYTSETIEEELIGPSVAGFLQKPFSAKGLIAKVAEALGAPASHSHG